MSAPSRSSPAITGEAWALIVLLSLPWGASFLFYRVLAAQLPPLTIVLGRVGIAAPVLYLLLRMNGQRLDIPWRGFAVMAVLNNVIPFTLYAWAETRVTSGVAAILNAFTPIAACLVLHAFGAERLTGLRVAGVVAGFAGVAVLVGPDLSALGRDFVADLACLGATVCYGFTALWGRRLRHVQPMQAAAGQLICSTVILLVPTLVIDQPWTLPMPDVSVWLNLFGIALLSTAVAYVVFFRILAVAGAGNVMLVTFLIPISALAMGAVFLGEPITLRAVGGMALIAVGLAAIDGRLFAAAPGQKANPRSP